VTTFSKTQRDSSEIDRRTLIAAYEASLAVAAEVDLDPLLQRLTDLAREVVGVKYCALSVTNQDGSIASFITSGISAEDRAAIGPPPVGRGLLGVIMHTDDGIIVPDIQADPRSIGFPPNHPPMKSMIGVPVMLIDRPVGNLYLCDRIDGRPFNEQDLAVVSILATHAATAFDRARLYAQLETSRRGAEEQRDQLRSIMDNLPSAVIIQSAADQSVEMANSTAMNLFFGSILAPATVPVYDRDFTLLREHGEPVPRHQQPAARAARGEIIRNMQLMLRKRSGQIVPVLVQAGPLRDADGHITRAVVVLQDITALREAEQLKDDFISLVSHELRTPITAVYGGSHLLANQRNSVPEETAQELLNDVVIESERLNQMLENLLSINSIRAGRLEPDTEPVLVEPLCRRVAADIARRTAIHRFEIDIDPSVPPVEADANHLEQVLRNLYENAIKYSPRGGAIRITASEEAGVVSIRVSDEGIGIAQDHLDQLFERFRRPGAPATVRGMGLGLYLSRHLVEAQGGELSVSSHGLGKGATFTILLPVARGWSDTES
jgi:signal transduction histidine kinase